MRAAPSPASRDGAAGDAGRTGLTVLLLAALACSACVRAPAREAPPAGLPELWVDAFAHEAGDGGVGSALRAVPHLQQPARVHLRSGLYAGPFEFPPGTQLEGHGVAVLHVEGAGTVVTARGALDLRRLTVQGGTVGLLAMGPVRLREVKFSGHRATAVQAFDAGVTAEQLELSSRLDGVVGVEAINAELRLEGVTLTGPMSHGVRAADSSVRIAKLVSEGPTIAVQVLRGSLEADDLRAAGGQGAAVLLTKAKGTLAKLDVTGHEYGLLCGGAQVTVRELSSRGAAAAGVSFFDSTVTMANVRVERAGPLGGVQLLSSTSTVGPLSVSASRGTGVLVRKGRATFGAVTIEGIEGERGRDGTTLSGDALEIRDAEVDVVELKARDLDGAGVYASNYGVLRAGTLEVERAGVGAVVVERRSTVTADRVISRGSRGPSLAAPEDGVLLVKSLTAQGGDVAVWADCDSGSRVTVQSVTDGTTLPALRCLAGPALRP
ncbi:MAG: hypothetical protein JNJ54_05600 [Myxococcaceae bacterium]|nr:hypothetical protein [Myxococcaceae bacterium]